MSKFLLAAVLALQLLQVTANEHCDDCESERIAPNVAVNDSSHCQFQLACNQNTPGTGHKYFRDNLEEDVITVERCYSFCFKNVRPHSMSHCRCLQCKSLLHASRLQFSSSFGSSLQPFPDIFAGDPCSDNTRDVSRHFYTACPQKSLHMLSFVAAGFCVLFRLPV